MSEGAAPAVAPSNGAPRNNAGQFAPKAGATGVAPAEGAAPVAGGQENAPPSGPQSVEDWGLEGEVEVYGEKQKVQWKSKAEALRAAQELAAYRKRVRDIAARERQLEEQSQMSVEDFARQRGQPIEELARRRVIEAAKLVDMTPQERENYELKQRIAAFEQQQQAEQQRREQQAEQQRKLQARQQAVAGLEKGLELSGLPKTHHSMALLAEIQQECVEQRLPPLPPDLLAAEANKRYAERGIEPLKKLKGKALLDRLGPELKREILLAVREERGLAAAAPRQSTVVSERELPQANSDKVYGEAEAEAMLRDLRNRR